METTERQTTRHLAAEALSRAPGYSFFQLVENLHRLHGDNLGKDAKTHPANERFVFSNYGGLGFPATDITRGNVIESNTDMEKYRLEVSFLGINGVSSPLPGYLLDQMAYEYGHETGVRNAFFDFFNHRLITHLHRIWRKYRYYVSYNAGATDDFSSQLFALIGLNDKNLRKNLPLPLGQLLPYIGQIASKSRSPAIVSGIIAHAFGLEHVNIREWEFCYIDISDDQKVSLGSQVTLGENFVIGNRVPSRNSKFVVELHQLDQKTLRKFLPNGEHFNPIKKLLQFLMRDQLACDLDLGLIQEQVPDLQLTNDSGCNLGWTTFLGEANSIRLQSTIRIKLR